MSPASPERIVLPTCVVDLVDGVVYRGGETLPLTRIERGLLAFLSARAGEVVERDTLLREVWGHDEAPSTRAVDFAVLRLRRKIESDPANPEHLRSVRGRGYSLAPSETERRTNLGAETTSFVGRSAELNALRDHLDSGARLVTVLGPPGAGKTRLARELGARSVRRWPGGAWLCELAEARDAADVAEAVAGALAVKLPGGPPDRLAPVLATRGEILLLLDNFEQLAAEAADTVAGWVRDAPAARFVVTSREPLGVAAETRLRLEPLSPTDAIALLLDRARALRGDFGRQEGDAVAEIVERLDRLPLALELAAGRAGLLTAQDLRDRLRGTLGLASAGARDLSRRQASVRGAVEWSWRLLDDAEREALALCSVFHGGFDLAAAEAVLEEPAADRLRALRDRSLLAGRSSPGGAPRFSLYQSVRELGSDKLAASGLAKRAADRHADWFLHRGEALLREMARAGTRETTGLLLAEVPNLLAAYRHLEADRPQDALRVALIVAEARLGEAPGSLLGLLDRAGALAVTPHERAAVLAARSTVLTVSGWLADALRDAEEAAALAEGDPPVESRALATLARVLEESGRFEESVAASLRGIAAATVAGDPGATANHHRMAASALAELNRLDPAREHLAAALASLGEGDGHPAQRAALHGVIGHVAHVAGDLEAALRHQARAVALARSLRQARFVATHVGNLGSVYADLGDLPRAEACHQETLAIVQELGLRRTEANTWANLALIAAAADDLPAARMRAERCLAVSRTLGAWIPEAAALLVLGMAALQSGDAPEALSRMRSAWTLLVEGGEPEFAPLARAWLAAAALRAGGDAAGHLEAARASGLPDTLALCDAIEGRHAGPATLHARIARRLFPAR